MSRFFTWTKGDRRVAEHASSSDGLVVVPAECLNLTGLNITRPKSAADPRALQPFNLSVSPSRVDFQRLTPASLVLHDAAVESATNLLAVVNDILRTPHMTQCAGQSLKPIQSRPRSRTAPSPPVFEVATTDPVELPAQSLVTFPKRHQHYDPSPNIYNSTSGHLLTTQTCANMSRSRTSSTGPSCMGHTVPMSAISPRSLSPDSCTPARRHGPNSHLTQRWSRNSQPVSTERAQQHHSSTPKKTQRPFVNTMQSRPRSLDSAHDSAMEIRHTNAMLPQSRPPLSGFIDHDTVEFDGSGANLQFELQHLRKAHDSYVLSLNDAHAREVEALKATVGMLEQRKSSSENRYMTRKSSRNTLSVHDDRKKFEELAGDAPSSRSSTSFESALEDQKKRSREAAAEVEGLKRKLSVFRQREMTVQDIRSERDDLRQSLEMSEQRMCQLKEALHRAQEDALAFKNTRSTLEAQLEAANCQRLDVMEGYSEACHRLRQHSEREITLMEEVKGLSEHITRSQALEIKLATSEDRNHFLQKQLASAPDKAGFAPLVTGLQEQLHKLQDDNDKKTRHIVKLEGKLKEQKENKQAGRPIAELEGQSLAKTTSEPGPCSSLISATTFGEATSPILADVTTLELVQKLQSERDQLQKLLHIELRRQSRVSTKADVPEKLFQKIRRESSPGGIGRPSASHNNSASSTTRTSFSGRPSASHSDSMSSTPGISIAARPSASHNNSVSSMTGTLTSGTTAEFDDISQTNSNESHLESEAEIRHLISEIVYYKLDIKGYRKDLRRAQTRIHALEEAARGQEAQKTTTLMRHDSLLRKTRSPTHISTPRSGAIKSEGSVPTILGLGIDLQDGSNGKSIPRSPSDTAKTTSARAPHMHNPSQTMAKHALPVNRQPAVLDAQTLANAARPAVKQRTATVPAVRREAPSVANQQLAHGPDRSGTTRSVSESIVSSYTKRT